MRLTSLASFLFLCCLCFFLGLQQGAKNPTAALASTTSSTAIVTPRPNTAALSAKAAAYDKWSQAEKVKVGLALNHELGKLTYRQRSQVWASMTVEEKAAAYDYQDKERQKKQSPFR